MVKIAVIGAGPKGVALASKCAVLKKLGYPAPELTVFEKDHVGAAWSGDCSFTNGEARICTNIERDLGFPYGDPVSDSINVNMLGEFSWRSFLLSNSSKLDLNEWLSKGCPRPSHREFSCYLHWAFQKSEALFAGGIGFENSAVSGLNFEGGNWKVSLETAAGSVEYADSFDGVIVTGVCRRSGPWVTDADAPAFDGANFWEDGALERLQDTIAKVLTLEDRVKVAVVGDGGTSAAVCHYLALHHRSRASLHINVFGSNPFFDSRPENYFSDRFYADDQMWRDRTVNFRRKFLGRTMRGRVWEPIIRDLQHCEIEYDSARVLAVRTEVLPGDRYQFEGDLCSDGSGSVTGGFEADILVDARGFDDFWFLNLFPDALSQILRPHGLEPRVAKETLEASLDNSFQVVSAGFPPGLHLPTLGSLMHAGANNLMALGSVTDSLLAPYRS